MCDSVARASRGLASRGHVCWGLEAIHHRCVSGTFARPVFLYILSLLPPPPLPPQAKALVLRFCHALCSPVRWREAKSGCGGGEKTKDQASPGDSDSVHQAGPSAA